MTDKVQKRWDKRKSKTKGCPNCGSGRIHLNRSICRTFLRYWLECWNCHCCGPRGNTINGAIRRWNHFAKEKEKLEREIIAELVNKTANDHF